MFFFASVPLAAWGVALAVLIGLMVLNEVSRRNKLTGIIFFIIVPIILSIFVWPKTSGAESGAATANWFQWAKTYSAIAGCLIFMGLRFSEKIRAKKWYYILPMAILNLNIAEAVVREFQVAGMGNQVVNGMTYIGGPWNIMNAIAGILTTLTVTGWFGIIISKSKTKDMIWPDMTWFWIVAYDLWNVAYLYNCVTDRAVYGGVVLLLAATIPAFTIKKGAWLQHRAHTLAIWMMIVMSFPSFFTVGKYAIASSHNTTAYYLVSIVALVFNIGVAVFEINTVVKMKKNPIKDEVYEKLDTYKNVKDANI